MNKLKRFSLSFLSLFLLCSCGTNNETGNDYVNNQSTKELEVFDLVLTVPENSFFADPSDPGFPKNSKNAFLLFYNDENDSEEKWRNQLIISRTEGVNATPNITYEEARIVVTDFANAYVGANPQWKISDKETVALDQTPAIHCSGVWETSTPTTIDMWFFMNNYHDVITFLFVHREAAKYDFTAAVDEIARSIHIKGLDGDLAFVVPTSVPSNNHSSGSSGCDGEKYGVGSDWAKYDENGDGCISDSEFQNGMNDAVENKLNGN